MSFELRRGLLLVYGLLNAVLYASLLPLWEGFDEEFHYGYVQFLGAHHRLPILGGTGLSEEINQSISLLPMSHVMIENLHLTGVRTFDQYFALDSATRHRLFNEARHISPELGRRERAESTTNYELHHAPLAYVLMAIPDLLLHNVALPGRVLVIRLIAAVAATLLTFFGALALAAQVELSDAFALMLVFLLFSCQMFWATVAHVGNDWLAAPLALWLIVLALRLDRAPSTGAAVRLGAVLGLGLLSKAYFLVFVPLYLVAAIAWSRRRGVGVRGVLIVAGLPLALAGPWYLRNVLIYGNLSGRYEESSGVGVGSALHSLASIPWVKSLPFMARGALWMGNSSFTDFSVRTMNAELVLLGIATVLYLRSLRRASSADNSVRKGVILGAPVILFGIAMIYVTGSSYSFTKGAAVAASPWYLQAVLPLLVCIALLGCQRSGRLGRWIAAITTVLWGYVLMATYLAKLIPLYGGFEGGRSTLRDVAHWYATALPKTADILDTTSLAPAVVLAVLFGCLLLTLVAIWPPLIRGMWSDR